MDAFSRLYISFPASLISAKTIESGVRTGRSKVGVRRCNFSPPATTAFSITRSDWIERLPRIYSSYCQGSRVQKPIGEETSPSPDPRKKEAEARRCAAEPGARTSQVEFSEVQKARGFGFEESQALLMLLPQQPKRHTYLLLLLLLLLRQGKGGRGFRLWEETEESGRGGKNMVWVGCLRL